MEEPPEVQRPDMKCAPCQAAGCGFQFGILHMHGKIWTGEEASDDAGEMNSSGIMSVTFETEDVQFQVRNYR
jgi:hypothetical protein